MTKKKIPLIDEFCNDIVCTVCLLPMQYQLKINDCFVWQCFKCGKKYFVHQNNSAYSLKESWSSSR